MKTTKFRVRKGELVLLLLAILTCGIGAELIVRTNAAVETGVWE